MDNADGVRDALKDLPAGVSDATQGIGAAIAEFQGLDEENAELFDRQLAESMQQEQDK